MAGKKSTRKELIERTSIMVGFLLDGLEPYEIRQYTSKEWEISGRQTDRYVLWANTRIQRAAERDDRHMLYTIKRRLVRQYRRAVQKGDGQLARLLIKDLRELYGFDKPKKVALTDPAGESEFSLGMREKMAELSVNDLRRIANGKTKEIAIRRVQAEKGRGNGSK